MAARSSPVSCYRPICAVKTAALANWRLNADANTGHGFAIFMASVIAG